MSITFKDVQTAEARVAKAEAKVNKSMNVFAKAAKDVEKANTELEKAVADCDKTIDDFQARMKAASDTKLKAFEAIKKNNTVINKLNEFIPTSNV
jgi:hypothetical protein